MKGIPVRSNAISELQEAVNALIEKGRPVFPLGGNKMPMANCKDCKNKSDAAHRATCSCLANGGLCHGFYAATKDPERFSGWLEEHPSTTLIAVPTGKETGIFVMEYDPKNGGKESFDRLMEKHDPIQTETNRSPSGGMHFVFRMPNFDFGNIHGKLWAGIDIKATGGYHLVPPSHYIDSEGARKEYTVVNSMDPQPAPEWLLTTIKDYLARNKWNEDARMLRLEEQKEYRAESLTEGEREHVEKTVKYWQSRITSAPDGTQNILIYTGARVLFSLCFAGMLDEEEAQLALEEACDEGNHPQHRSILAIDSGKRAAYAKPDPVQDALSNDINILGTFTRDDIGNANRVVFWRGQDLRFDPTRERFYYWADTRWIFAREGHIRSVVEDVHDKIAATEGPFYSDFAMPPGEADKKSPKTYRELLVEWANNQRYAGKIKDTMNMLKGRETLWCESDDFDVDPYLFNVANGVVDLRTGELKPHDRTFMCSKISKNIKYDPDAECPEFERFLRLVQPNEVHRKYLQRLMGYTIIGEVGRDQIFALHIGKGGNGKGVFLDSCKYVLGEYVTTGQRDSFVRKSNANRIPADIASMEGMRMVLVDELNDGQKLDDGLLKEITGGGTIKAEAKMMNPWEYTPKFTLHFRTNVMPDLPADQAILRRFRPVKWTEQPSGEQWDTFTDEFHSTVFQYLTKKEGPGILNWILQGTREYLEQGLSVPDDLQSEAVDMLEEGDPFLLFMRERVSPAPGGRVEGSKLYKEFKTWYEDMGFSGKPPSSRSIYKDVEDGKYKNKGWVITEDRQRKYFCDIQLSSLLLK
jgi:P4 family phage/plasmid primase-like protien